MQLLKLQLPKLDSDVEFQAFCFGLRIPKRFVEWASAMGAKQRGTKKKHAKCLGI